MGQGGREKHRNERCGKIVIDFPFGARLPNRSNERFPVWQFFIWHYCIAPTIHFHWIDIQSKCKYLYVSSIQSSLIVISALLSITDFSTFQSGSAQALCVLAMCLFQSTCCACVSIASHICPFMNQKHSELMLWVFFRSALLMTNWIDGISIKAGNENVRQTHTPTGILLWAQQQQQRRNV